MDIVVIGVVVVALVCVCWFGVIICGILEGVVCALVACGAWVADRRRNHGGGVPL